MPTTAGNQKPHLTLAKSADPKTYSNLRPLITYFFPSTTLFRSTLHNVTVSDPKVSGLSCTPANGSDLAPGDSITCTATHTITQADLDAGSYNNNIGRDDG